MGVIQVGEFRKDLHNLVCTLTTGCNDHDIGFRLLRDSMLEHRLSRTERTGDKSRTTLYDGVESVDDTDTRFEQFERTRLLAIASDSTFHRPFLHHGYIVVFPVLIRYHSDHIVHFVRTGFGQTLHLVIAFENERHHDLVRLEILRHLSEP